MGLFSGIGDALFGSDKKVKVPDVDPNEVINRQTSVNRIDQTTPFGSVNFSGPDRNKLNFALSPQMQALFNAQSGFGTQATDAGSGLLNASGIGPVGTQDVSQLQDALFQNSANRIQPIFDQRRERLQEFQTQGGNNAVGADLAPGAVSELDVLGRQENDALTQLGLQAALAGPQFQSQLLNNQINQQGANIGNSLALGNASPIGVPQFNFQGASPADITGAFSLGNNAAQFNAGQQQKQRSGILGGLFDLGGAGIAKFG